MLFYSTLIALWLDSGDEHLRHANHALVDGCRQNSGLPKIDPLIAMFNEVALTAMKSHAGGIGNGIILEGA